MDTVHVAYTIYILSKSTYSIYIYMFNIYICQIYIYIYLLYIYCIYYINILHIIYMFIYIYTTHTLYITYSISILIIDTYALYALYALKRLHTPWFLSILTSAAHAVPWTLLAHSLHWAIYFAYIGLAAEKTPPPLPQGGGNHLAGGGGGVGVPAHIYIYMYMYILHPSKYKWLKHV